MMKNSYGCKNYGCRTPVIFTVAIGVEHLSAILSENEANRRKLK